MKVVITGITGNLGTSLQAALAADPRVSEIVGIARRLPATRFAKVHFVRADVASDALTGVFEGADAVVHLAWRIRSAHELDELERNNVEGSKRVFVAAATAGVPSILYASSVGAYSPSLKSELRSELWPTDGVESSPYSRQKAAVEHFLDDFERAHGRIRVVRFRPALMFKRSAAMHIRDVFMGALVPKRVFDPRYLKFVLNHPKFKFQAVHSDDVASAFQRALFSEARGAFNIAADPVLDSDTLAQALHAKKLAFDPRILRAVTSLAFRLRLTPADPGWLDLCFQAPLLDCRRAREVLGFRAQQSSLDALLEVVEGLRSGAGFETPALGSDARHSQAVT